MLTFKSSDYFLIICKTPGVMKSYKHLSKKIHFICRISPCSSDGSSLSDPWEKCSPIKKQNVKSGSDSCCYYHVEKFNFTFGRSFVLSFKASKRPVNKILSVSSGGAAEMHTAANASSIIVFIIMFVCFNRLSGFDLFKCQKWIITLLMCSVYLSSEEGRPAHEASVVHCKH